jgi:uncharacterized protein
VKRRVWLAGLGGVAVLLAGAAAWRATGVLQPGAPVSYRNVSWLDLVPADWKPQERIDMKRAASLSDEDTLAKELMKELREILDTAPTVPAMDGQHVRMPGFVVPLEGGAQGLREFLLVPYFGACIHTPPPPANQIVHVVSPEPVTGFGISTPVWVRGTMRTSRSDTAQGVSGYTMELAHIAHYEPDPASAPGSAAERAATQRSD